MACILVGDLELLEAFIHVRTLSIVVATNILTLAFLTRIRRRVAIGTVARATPILLLDLRMELTKLHLFTALHLNHKHGHLLVALLELSLRNR